MHNWRGSPWPDSAPPGALSILTPMTERPLAVMTKDEFLRATDDLVTTGDSIVESPEWDRFRDWLIASDTLLERVWGRMDRYHLAWLNVGRGSAPPGSSLNEEGTRRFIGEVASGKLAVLRTMRGSVARQGWTLLADDAPDEEGG